MNTRLLAPLLALALSASSPAFADGEPTRARDRSAPSALDILAAANAEARQAPARARFVGARQIYAWRPGALYELHASPAFVSAILLESGEALVSIAAGDTQRWSVSEARRQIVSAL